MSRNEHVTTHYPGSLQILNQRILPRSTTIKHNAKISVRNKDV